MRLDSLLSRIGLTFSRRAKAAQWHVRLRSDLATEAEFKAFELWVLDPSNRRAYDAIELLSVELDERRWELKSALAGSALARRDDRGEEAGGRIFFARVAIISLAVAIVIGGVFALSGDRPLAWTSYGTARGGHRNINLSDGSEIILNVNSTIRVAMERNVRRVQMGDAEASFHVAKDRKRPFIIAVGSQEIRVIGTQFNVLHHLDRTVVSVREGIVDVSTQAGSGSPHRLGPGDQLVHRDGAPDTLIQLPDPETAFAWQAGHLVYFGTTLGDVVADLNRYFTIPIRTEGIAASLKFSGILSIDSEEAVVRRLEEFLPVATERSSNAFILRRKPVP